MSQEARKAHEKFWSLIEDIETAMLTTRDGDMLRSRPMHVIASRGENRLWIFSNAEFHTAEELARSPEVNLSFVDLKRGLYLSVSGHARLLEAPDKARELWNDAVAVWYEHGLEDPAMRLICVEPHHGEYWDNDQRRMVRVLEYAVAAATPDTPDITENRKLEL
jgi:general stress protein 26